MIILICWIIIIVCVIVDYRRVMLAHFLGILTFLTLTGIINYLSNFLTKQNKIQLLNFLDKTIIITFLIIAILLIISNIIILRREGFKPSYNIVGILGFDLLWCILGFNILDSSYPISTPIIKIFTFSYLISWLFLLGFINYVIYSLIIQLIPQKKNFDYIIVLGANVLKPEPSPLLKARLDKAIEIYKSQTKKPKIVVSGGQNKQEPFSEALVMKNYLINNQIDQLQIITEEKARNTFENMQYAKELIDKDAKTQLIENPKITFVTTNYHVFRSSIYAKKNKITAFGFGSKTAIYYLPHAYLKEYIATIRDSRSIKGTWIGIIIIAIYIIKNS